MADEQDRWLDPETAERLLRGESLDTVDATARDRAERLARALDALAAEPYADTSSAAELPGEAAALAAFRKAAAERADARAAAGSAPAHGGDAGLVRIGAWSRPRGRTRPQPRPGAPRRTRRWRPVRLVLSAALAAGAVGGVAAAATTGVLPTPFGGDDPAPAASVSTGPTPGRPAATLSADSTPDGGPDAPATGPATAGSSGADHDDTARDGAATPGHDAAPGATGGPGDGSRARRDPLALACRDLRDGKSLNTARKRALDGAAGGSSRVYTYCDGILKALQDRASGRGGALGRGTDEDGDRSGQGGGEDRGSGRGRHGGDGRGGDDGQSGDEEGHSAGDHRQDGPPRRDGVTAPPLSRLLPQRTTGARSPAPPAAAPSNSSR
ncbi:extensin [Streptomyces sp. GMY01]|uniref:extensin n=1 Tax=Streptomyces sp. GMY02 TaxID=1333528 RepID=UPI00146B8DB0|nr:extensin [Streptomyces sp. GMY02]NMO32401.1 extensin [Streptomyces sp. GMY02]